MLIHTAFHIHPKCVIDESTKIHIPKLFRYISISWFQGHLFFTMQIIFIAQV